MPNLVKIWSFEHNAWWRPRECGYTQNEKEAGLYPRERAVDIVAGANITGTINEQIVELHDPAPRPPR